MSKVAEILATLDYGPAPEAVNLANEWLDAHARTFGFYVTDRGLTLTPISQHFRPQLVKKSPKLDKHLLPLLTMP